MSVSYDLCYDEWSQVDQSFLDQIAAIVNPDCKNCNNKQTKLEEYRSLVDERFSTMKDDLENLKVSHEQLKKEHEQFKNMVTLDKYKNHYQLCVSDLIGRIYKKVWTTIKTIFGADFQLTPTQFFEAIEDGDKSAIDIMESALQQLEIEHSDHTFLKDFKVTRNMRHHSNQNAQKLLEFLETKPVPTGFPPRASELLLKYKSHLVD